MKNGREEAANAERDSRIVGNSEKEGRLIRVYGNDFRRDNESEGERRFHEEFRDGIKRYRANDF